MIEQKMALDNLIYKIRIGSNMYGTMSETSDLQYTPNFEEINKLQMTVMEYFWRNQ